MAGPRTPDDEEARLQALAALRVVGTDREERFDRLTRLTQRLFGVPMAFVNLVEGDRLWVKSAQGLDVREVPRTQSFCAHTIEEPGGMVVEDAAQDPRFAELPQVRDGAGMRFYAGVPLEAPGGHRVGTLCIADTAPRHLEPADLELLRDLGRFVQKELDVSQELERAAQMQRALLPSKPLADERWDVAGACRTSRDVGGDFVDWHRSPVGSVVALGDIMGKGLPAAIMAASIRSAVRAAARRRSLAQGIEDAAAAVIEDLEATGTFATVFVARLEDEGRVTYIDAGHAHARVVRARGGVEELGPRGLPVGIDAEERYRSDELQLAPGDLLIAHSDGLLELEDGPRSTDEVAALVRPAARPAEVVCALTGLIGAAPPPDDVTVLAVQTRA
jgi:stage II sporulation SpoE-like protein/GAF domain-containing protein